MVNRLMVVFMALIVLMQGAILFRQGASRPANPAATSRNSIQYPPEGTMLDISAAPSKGSSSVRAVLVEFSDYECPFCVRHANGAGKELDKTFVESGKIRYVFLNNPLPIHPHARMFAKAAMCAGKQGHYWEMHDLLFGDKPANEDEVVPIAKKLSLDDASFKECLKSDSNADNRIDSDIAAARRLGLTGTPGFAIGVIDPEGRVKVHSIVMGALSAETFGKAINEVLAKS